ncbi:ubiquitin-conjugating enzyme family protein [Reticulomyxa filosa]|uniref:Ubiquitin-conjugating enzyme family protein n=1 Tax=Reticulomyxa filosa TaxID=46433 RepID=X6N808_RETFI|nr:ubiquitin-conjugating enzyme family protein [Reticulomyxa filosa]|eukprot:ETO22201.1 ubiquitin-conjugating enzyme family protein [Reticulomyxa filosa]
MSPEWLQKKYEAWESSSQKLALVQKFYPSDPKDWTKEWKVLIQGPEGTPYEKGVYEMELMFVDQFAAPKAKFVNIPHVMNVKKMGELCLRILSDQWSAAITFDKLFETCISETFHTGGFLCTCVCVCEQYATNIKGGYGLETEVNKELKLQYERNLPEFLHEASVKNHEIGQGPKPCYYTFPQMTMESYYKMLATVTHACTEFGLMPADLVQQCLIPFLGTAKETCGLFAFGKHAKSRVDFWNTYFHQGSQERVLKEMEIEDEKKKIQEEKNAQERRKQLQKQYKSSGGGMGLYVHIIFICIRIRIHICVYVHILKFFFKKKKIGMN